MDDGGFGRWWLADVIRIALAFGGMFLVLLCIRIAWLRARDGNISPLRDRSPWALLSYAAFALLPTAEAIGNIGEPPEATRLGLYAVALASGMVAAFGQVTLSLWTGGGTAAERVQRAKRAARPLIHPSAGPPVRRRPSQSRPLRRRRRP